jgi:hypothetical protein
MPLSDIEKDLFDTLIDKFELNIKPIISLARSDSLKNLLNDKNGDDFAIGMIFGESMGIFVTQVGDSGRRTFSELEMDEMKMILSKRMTGIKDTIFQLG